MSKFKKGDKVRHIGDKHAYTNGHIGIVGDSLRGKALVTFDGVKAVFNESELELVASDPTAAFLTELQELMRKYDAVICYNHVFQQLEAFVRGVSLRYRNGLNITPDNIFDYEK